MLPIKRKRNKELNKEILAHLKRKTSNKYWSFLNKVFLKIKSLKKKKINKIKIKSLEALNLAEVDWGIKIGSHCGAVRKILSRLMP